MTRTDPEQTTNHETTDVNLRPVILAGLSLAFVIVMVSAGMWVMFRSYAFPETNPQASILASDRPRLPPQPRLQSNPIEDLQRLHAREDAILHRYGWVDRQAGVVQIPIERAMDLVAADAAAASKGTPAQ